MAAHRGGHPASIQFKLDGRLKACHGEMLEIYGEHTMTVDRKLSAKRINQIADATQRLHEKIKNNEYPSLEQRVKAARVLYKLDNKIDVSGVTRYKDHE
ncbi:MAG: hypothetical protein WCD42_11705 [Rhizomicrobium sp.]